MLININLLPIINKSVYYYTLIVNVRSKGENMKNIEKTDRRVERTRSSIIKAFKEMIIEKDFKQITIKELAERANINRKTFYLHYESMEEILFDLTIELSDQIFEMLVEKGYFSSEGYDIQILVDILDEIINSNYELTKKLVSANSYRFFSRNIKDIIKESFIRKIKNKTNLTPYTMNIVGDYIGSGLAKVLKDWFEDPGDLSSSEIALLISTLIYGGMRSIMELDNKKIVSKN